MDDILKISIMSQVEAFLFLDIQREINVQFDWTYVFWNGSEDITEFSLAMKKKCSWNLP